MNRQSRTVVDSSGTVMNFYLYIQKKEKKKEKKIEHINIIFLYFRLRFNYAAFLQMLDHVK